MQKGRRRPAFVCNKAATKRRSRSAASWQGAVRLVKRYRQENKPNTETQASEDVRGLYLSRFLANCICRPIVHPLVDPRTSRICLITKDPQREYKDLLEAQNIKFISRVVGLEKLKGKFKPFEARRALLKENGLFLADERILPLLPKLLGSKWFEAKK